MQKEVIMPVKVNRNGILSASGQYYVCRTSSYITWSKGSAQLKKSGDPHLHKRGCLPSSSTSWSTKSAGCDPPCGKAEWCLHHAQLTDHSTDTAL